MEEILNKMEELKIEKNKTKKKTNKEKIDEIFKPNENGVSDWISRETLDKTQLKWGSNGVFRNGVFKNDKRYIWVKYPKMGKILKIRTNGFNVNQINTRPIRKDIHDFHKNKPNGGACVHCGQTSNLVTDHKNDLYNDPRVLNKNTQKKEDFQCLCNGCNLQKREICKKTKKSNKRYKATEIPKYKFLGIDFISGDETFDINDKNAMVGTYYYDPVVFIKVAFKEFAHKKNK